MAFTKMGNFSFNHSGQPETLPYAAEDAQAKFDSRANELKAAFNRVVDLLNATADGASGADNVGMTPIAGLGTAANVQAQMESMKGLVDGKAASDDLSGLAGTGRTTETVKGNADDLAAHLAETVAHAELINRTITVGQGKNFTSIQAAINSVKKQVDANITINVDAGTYAEEVIISGFYGSGSITLNGGSSLEIAYNYMISNISVKNCTLSISVNGFKSINTTSPFEFICCSSANINRCESDSIGINGIVAIYSRLMVFNCLISNKTNSALLADACSTVYSANWAAGNGNTTGLRCQGASVIGKHGTQPQGETAEAVIRGGEIR